MPRFFTDNIDGKTAVITGDDAKHLSKVLRAKIGEKVTVCDKSGFDYDCEIAQLGENVVLRILSKVPNETEPSVCVHLFQALPKSDKMEFIIQKAVELGVSEITPVLTSRCVSRPDEGKMKKKIARWNAVAEAAAKQSGRGIIPVVHEMQNFNDAIKSAAECEIPIIFYENGGERINELVSPDAKSISIFIGSEGGFDESEIEKAKIAGLKTATLGKRILRCETAPVAGLSIIMNITENM